MSPFTRLFLPGSTIAAWCLSLVIPAACGVVFAPNSAAADEAAQVTVRVGVGGFVKVGRWTPVVATVSSNVESAVAEAADPYGNTVRYPLKRTVEGNKAVFRGLIRIGRIESSPRLVLKQKDGTTMVYRVEPDAESEEMKPLLRQSVAIVVVLGPSTGFRTLNAIEESPQGAPTEGQSAEQKSGSRVVKRIEWKTAQPMPSSVYGLSAVDAVVITGPYTLTAEQNDALRRWVWRGGCLVVCRGSNLDAFVRKSTNAKQPTGSANDDLLAAWLPVRILGQRTFDGTVISRILKIYSSKKTPLIRRAIPVAELQNPELLPDTPGRVLAGRVREMGRTDPLIVRSNYGFGVVTFCGLDLDRSPIADWDEVDAVGTEMLKERLETVTATVEDSGGRISRSGVTDLSTQLHAIEQEFPEVKRMSAWTTMVLLLVYILLIGPIDYLIVHRWLKRPRLTWITLPVIVAVTSWFAIRHAREDNGSVARLNQFNVVDIDATQTSAREQQLLTRSWATLFSPETRRYRLVAERESLAAAGKGARSREPALLGWSGVPENVFGGMYRSGGLAIDRLRYTIQPEEMTVDDLPLRIWSAQSLSADAYSRRPVLVESRIGLTRTKSLAGTLTHKLPVPIEDWVIFYKSNVYRPDASAKDFASLKRIPPGVSWSIAQRGITKFDLIDDLTRSRAGEDTDADRPARRSRQDYDVNGRDADYFLRVLTVHTNMSGSKYTGLNNISLSEMDLSRLLRLNRAILVGRIRNTTPLSVKLAGNSGGGDRIVNPERSDTFVRIVLPVLEHVDE